MNRHALYSIFIIAVILIIPMTAYGAFGQQLTQSFGGRVLISNLPSANCIGLGTGPMLVTNTIGLPLYATPSFSTGGLGFLSATPRTGDWILGRVQIIPNFSRCYTQGTTVPFPVRDTSFYGVSN